MTDNQSRNDSAARPRPNRLGLLFAVVWLVFLGGPLIAGWNMRDQASGVVGMIATVAFGALYVLIFDGIQRHHRNPSAIPNIRDASLRLGALIALASVMIVCLGPTGLTAAPFLAVTSVMLLPAAAGGILTLILAGSVEVISISSGWGNYSGLSLAVCAAAFAMWGVQSLIGRNNQILREREAREQRAIADERTRMARDLHDILGHSLTVITVKAELTNRLLDIDINRARSELDDLERLSRDALADVRSAVDGFRTISLPMEIARAREALRAAGIEDHTPNSTEMVPGHLRELFAWTIREGITNVVRHSAATQCTITVDANSVEITDNGVASGRATIGNGLTGLRERAAAAGARVIVTSLPPHGFSLQVRKQETT
ncbi:histidine kinase [Rhodococcus sp. IEGM 1379]|uniref:sensor histidine kinase n=1 Tax=Rhodococcus sp. IEGM 1379 TaxID=3047086 RepID=UPI0024B8663D|nr:histidine kinase [Rhodococcus sp. IEGM 1379]MDI9914942.1 histidine kinase [Rhodococcus sp. IEGM 1379]